jgi:hypothetical protein
LNGIEKESETNLNRTQTESLDDLALVSPYLVHTSQ